MKRLLVGGCAALLVAACAEDPSLFLGGPPGPAERLQLSSGTVTLTVGESIQIGAVAYDQVGNVTGDAPTFSACSGAPVSIASADPHGVYMGAATVTASATAIGEGCVNVSAGGLSDSLHVVVGPAGVLVDGPLMVGSGNTAAFSAMPFDAGGSSISGSTPYTWSSSNTARLVIHPHTGAVNGRSTGPVAVRLRAPNGATAVQNVTVVAGTFEGTLGATSGSPGALVTATRAAGMEPWDANSGVRLDGRAGFVDSYTADELAFVVPPTGATTQGTLNFFNIGSSEISQEADFTPTSATGHPYQPATDACATAPDIDANASDGGWVYFTVTDQSVGWGGANPDVWFRASAGATDRDVTARLEWTIPVGTSPYADLDIYIYDACGGANVGGSAQYNPPQGAFEEDVITIPAGATWYFQVRTWDDQGSVVSGARLALQ